MPLGPGTANCLRLVGALGFLLLGGCYVRMTATTRQCGDARVTCSQPVAPAPLSYENWEVVLPPVSLSQAGTTELRVDSLPELPFSYRAYLDGGNFARNHHAPSALDSWKTRIAVRVTTPDGVTLLRAEGTLLDLLWHEHGVLKGPLNTSATAFRIQVTVLKPSAVPGEQLFISGNSYRSLPAGNGRNVRTSTLLQHVRGH